MLLLIPIFEVEDDETNFLLPNEVKQEGFLKAFMTVQEAEEYIFRKGYTQNVNSTWFKFSRFCKETIAVAASGVFSSRFKFSRFCKETIARLNL